jgi:hypothetical protein
MKKVFSILFAAGVMTLVACGSGDQAKTETPAADSSAAAAPAPAVDSSAVTAAPADSAAH